MATLTLPRIAAGENLGRAAPERITVDVGAVLLAALDRVEDWIERHHQRHVLAEMSEAQLKDVGLSGADVAREAAKPFWQA